MSEKIERFLSEKRRETPFLVLDLDLVVERYRLLKEALPTVGVYYAVKANPAEEIIVALEREGACFDVAGIAELEGCARLGIPASRMSYGHTIKKETDIAGARTAGIDLFAFDCKAEIQPIQTIIDGAKEE